MLSSIKLRSTYLYSTNNPTINKSNGKSVSNVEDEETKRWALGLLDAITSPTEEADPDYDAKKATEARKLLSSFGYTELKVECKLRGLRTSGDKLEMLTRILLFIIDPTMKLNER